MLKRVWDYLVSLVSPRPVRLAIVRRYTDANGHYVGELYMEKDRKGVSSYCMVGVSLDSLPKDPDATGTVPEMLDTRHDFLAPLQPFTIRVGAIEPGDNDKVRRMVARLPRKRMTIMVRNGFIEDVPEGKSA